MSRGGIKCPRCGNINTFGRVFCSKCGVRLDLSRVNNRVLAKSIERPHSSALRLFRFLLFVALLAVVALLLWPSGLVGAPGALRDARSMERKIAAVVRAQQAGLYVFEIISEREANAYLAEILKRNEGISRSEGMKLGIEAITMGFQPDGLTVVILAAWGPLRISYEVTGMPVIDEEGFKLDVISARWGHLPLPGPSGQWVSERVARVFSQMQRERRMLDDLQRCDVGKGKVRLVTKGRR